MLTVCDLGRFRDRYPTADERDRLLAYAGSIGGRAVAADEMAALAGPVTDAVMARMKQLYPNVPRFHAAGYEKGYRDNRLLLEYMTKAMLLDDVQLLNDQVLTWVRTLFKSFNFTPKFMRDNFALMRDEVRTRAKPRTFALMEPFLTHTMNYLSDIPEPVRPEV